MSNEAWEHLPNAAHIARILAHVKAHPDKWSAALDAAGVAARYAAWETAWDAAWETAWDAAGVAARYTAWDAARYTAWDAARDALAALVVWDEAGDILKLPPATVKFLADQGVHAAVLLYPAVLAMEVMNEQ